jgi:S1-C subfamily serine protease
MSARARITALWARLRKSAFFGGMFGALVVFLLAAVLFPTPRQPTAEEYREFVSAVMASVTPRPPRAVLINQLIQPSLVLVQTERTPTQDDDGNSLGSGVVVNDKGEVLTALHVVRGANRIVLRFADSSESEADIATEQPENDIAVLRPRVPPAQIVPAPLGNPGGLRIGDDAYVVGHPVGLYGSMSSGVISGLDRTFTPRNSDYILEGLIQIDAAVNPGSSGGPLLNANGEVVGIITALLNPAKQEAFSGIGFAVPINVAGGAAGLPTY